MTTEWLGLDLVTRPATASDGTECALARVGGESKLVVIGPVAGQPAAFEGDVSDCGNRRVLVGPRSARNAAALRERLAWLRPAPLGLQTSAGFGDRLGLGTPGHIAALRSVGGSIAPIFAQQSMREMSRTGRSAQQVVDDAMWAVFAADWRAGFGADADHLKQTADIDTCLAAGFTFFTFDPGEHVEGGADTMDGAHLREAFERLPWQALDDTADSFEQRWRGSGFDADGYLVSLDARSALVAAVKYGRAVAHVAAMYRHLAERAGGRPFEVEVSLDETDTPTSHGEHLYVASELRRLGVRWVSLAPRFVGRFEKGVDYIGDLAAFDADVTVHAAIARTVGPYKLSLHSGSDKFAIYDAAARESRGLVHLKTAGTSWLEALRTIAVVDPGFFREIYAFARERYDTDRASYHVSATVAQAPAADAVGRPLESLLDDFHARQILHVTFGSVLTARTADGRLRFGDRLMALLREHPDAYSLNLERHFRRHLLPFAGQKP
jgi:tagaturonate epimerase